MGWPTDEWVKIVKVSKDHVILTDHKFSEAVIPYDKNDDEWILVHPEIELKPLASDLDE